MKKKKKLRILDWKQFVYINQFEIQSTFDSFIATKALQNEYYNGQYGKYNRNPKQWYSNQRR